MIRSTNLSPNFNRYPLIPAIAQDGESLEILMVAFMDQEAWDMTLQTGFAHYHSRTRKSLWKKGETSGHFQEITEIRIDCDKDAILLIVQQTGPACHTGNQSCFYRTVSPNPIASPELTPPLSDGPG